MPLIVYDLFDDSSYRLSTKVLRVSAPLREKNVSALKKPEKPSS